MGGKGSQMRSPTETGHDEEELQHLVTQYLEAIGLLHTRKESLDSEASAAIQSKRDTPKRATVSKWTIHDAWGVQTLNQFPGDADLLFGSLSGGHVAAAVPAKRVDAEGAPCRQMHPNTMQRWCVPLVGGGEVAFVRRGHLPASDRQHLGQHIPIRRARERPGPRGNVATEGKKIGLGSPSPSSSSRVSFVWPSVPPSRSDGPHGERNGGNPCRTSVGDRGPAATSPMPSVC